MSWNFMFEDEFERAEKQRIGIYRLKKILNDITRQHPEAIAVAAAGIGILMLCFCLVFITSECTYRYRLGHWVEQAAVYDGYYGENSIKCHYDVDGETRYAIVPRETGKFYSLDNSVTIYLKPSDKYQYIGKQGVYDELMCIAMCAISFSIAATCLILSRNAYTEHYLFKGSALFSQRMSDMGISTKQNDDFFY